MNTLKSTPELKSRAKGLLLGRYGTVIPALLIINVITFLISMIVVGFLDISSIWGLIIYYIYCFLMQLFSSIFLVGQCRLYLNISCGCQYAISDIFYGFQKFPDKAIYSQFIILLKEVICLLPAMVLCLLYRYTKIIWLLPAASICAAAGMVIAVLIALSYSQVFFLMLDFPQYPAKELLRVSKKMMHGNRGSFFYLQVTFLPLILLSLVTCGIGLLWVTPYINATTAQFYLDLIRIKSSPKSPL